MLAPAPFGALIPDSSEACEAACVMTGFRSARRHGTQLVFLPLRVMTMIDYVGIDVSQAVLDVCLPNGQVLTLAQSETGYAELVALVPPTAVCVLEATGPYGLRLLAALAAAGRAASVVNPLQVRRFAQSQLRRGKTDRTDARVLAAFGRAFTPRLTDFKPLLLTQLQQRQALLELLRQHLTALRNHQHALEQAPWPDPVSAAEVAAQIGALEGRIAALEADLDRATCAAFPEAQRLRTIPGLGPRTVAALLLAGPGLAAFPGWRQAVAYAGLCPRHYESGTSVRARPRLSKLGDGRLRRLLYLAAWSAARYNPACKALYERLLERGKAKMQALCAVAARLLRQAWAIVKFDREFDPNYHLRFAN